MKLNITQIDDGPHVVDDGATRHTFTDPAAMRHFVTTWQAIRATYPDVAFTLADDATVVEWHRPGPRPDFLQVVADYEAAQTQQASEQTALRQRVRTLAQSAVGVAIDALTPAQIRALLAVLLHKQGAIDGAGVVRPLSEWE